MRIQVSGGFFTNAGIGGAPDTSGNPTNSNSNSVANPHAQDWEKLLKGNGGEDLGADRSTNVNRQQFETILKETLEANSTNGDPASMLSDAELDLIYEHLGGNGNVTVADIAVFLSQLDTDHSGTIGAGEIQNLEAKDGTPGGLSEADLDLLR